MPNLRGPGEAKRRLYANVVLSVILYATPIWCDALKASAKSQRIVNKVLHTVAVRVIAAYRTISLDVALLLARIPPLSLMADERRRTAERVSVLRSEGTYDRRCLVGIRVQESDKTLEKWATYLASPGLAGTRTISAILPCLNEWMNRRSGGLTFRLTQVLSGHGCFGCYLHIRRVPDPTCVACDSGDVDTPEHTLSYCSRWQAERSQLIRKIGRASFIPGSAPASTWILGGSLVTADDDPVLAIGSMVGLIDDEDVDPDLADPARRAADMTLEHMVAAMLGSGEASGDRVYGGRNGHERSR